LAFVFALSTEVAHAAAPSPPAPGRDGRFEEPTDFSLEGYHRWLGGVAMGRGVRFNNPYRLRTVLGDDAESLSLTAPYLDAWGAFAFGQPNGWQHGPGLHASIAVEGVSQEVMTPSYLLLADVGRRWLLLGRAGLPIVIEPDANAGVEVAFGAIYRVTAALALTAELIGDLFYGAATLDSARTAIPIMSLQLGAACDYEVLP
jgi:hypothetical protein